MMRPWLWLTIFAFLLAGLVSGCRSITPPVTYYTLNATTLPPAESNDGAKADLTVGIRSVGLPGYVNRQQMVVRSGANRLLISSLNRWADYPDRMVQQTIGENLQWLMPHIRMVNAPWPVEIKPDVILSFQFLELIGTGKRRVSLTAIWTIAGSPDKATDAAVVQTHRTHLIEPITGSGFGELAAAHSRAIGTLCRKVATALDAYTRSR
ncbi:membrane integrity-associated transporter subunit PqiC [Desulfosarcina ovata]|uniref:ABC-type transport auxiliary lipoprotein component domain-containing protein n=2 Tax=Desulfosarcina ovata TaxID=83564 RepID=A0A5K8A678_9BACT|nr:PqiC family protein [Desulfosarcina ovata]BBO80686.1 hypothetical protein DSCO28_12520 [Desulfosarcina ovata subsp. sediminis]BBO87898.1 hypothetical protein DSCOOX_10780 [Desulfosarcina ovata subsp. ovata]